MGSKVNRNLDIKKVDAALQRAAYRAIHGTRAERSGRFPAGGDAGPCRRRSGAMCAGEKLTGMAPCI